MGIVYLIPSLLHEDGLEAMPAYLLAAVKDCQVFLPRMIVQSAAT